MSGLHPFDSPEVLNHQYPSHTPITNDRQLWGVMVQQAAQPMLLGKGGGYPQPEGSKPVVEDEHGSKRGDEHKRQRQHYETIARNPRPAIRGSLPPQRPRRTTNREHEVFLEKWSRVWLGMDLPTASNLMRL